MHSMCIVAYITVNSITILNAAQKCFYGEFMSPPAIKLTKIVMQCPILTKLGISQPIFTEIRPVRAADGQAEREADGHEDSN